MPYVCEEVWSWWQKGSVHRAPWPDAAALVAESESTDAAREQLALDVAAEVLHHVRKAKSSAKQPMRAPVERVIVSDTPERLGALDLAERDLRLAGSIAAVERREAEEFAVEVQLAEGPDAAELG